MNTTSTLFEEAVLSEYQQDKQITMQHSFEAISAKELKNAKLEPLQFLVKNILPVGCSMIAAAPKIGKSWFVLDMGLAIASGETFLSQATRKSRVMYLALEDSKNRLQDRMNKILANGEAPDGFYFAVNAPTIDNGLIETLDYWISEYKIDVFIIDTFQKIRGTAQRNETQYQHDYREMGTLKQFADSKKVSLFFVHHIRKMRDDEDVYNMISGSQGLMGALDTTYVLYKKRDDEKAVLNITGRDVLQRSDVISFNKELYKWQRVGDFGELQKQQRKHNHNSSPIVKTIIQLLDENPKGWSGKMHDLLIEGERITGEDIADSEIKLAYAIKKMTKELAFYNNIIVDIAKNGSGGKMYHFSKSTISTSTNDIVYSDYDINDFEDIYT